MAKNFLDQFVQDGTISRDQLMEAEGMASSQGISVEDALIRMEYIGEADLLRAKAAQFGFQFVNLDTFEISHSVIELVPESVARENVCLPIEFENERLTVAVVDPMNFELVEKLRFVLNRDVEMVMSPKEQILAGVNRYYGQGGQTESVDSMLQEFTETAIDFTETELNQAKTLQ